MTTTEDLGLLRSRVGEVLADHGLVLWQLVLAPDVDGVVGLHIVAGLAQDDAPNTDDGFDQVIESAARAEADERARRSIDELTERLRRGGGFLDFGTEP
jgi:hypothetical protein